MRYEGVKSRSRRPSDSVKMMISLNRYNWPDTEKRNLVINDEEGLTQLEVLSKLHSTGQLEAVSELGKGYDISNL